MPVVRIFRRNADASAPGGDTPGWEWEVRPRRSARTARITAVVLVVVSAAAGIWLRSGSTGVHFRVADQISMFGIGLLGAAAVLLLTRPRVRVGAEGVSVRNVLGDNFFPWRYVRGVSFPDRKSWARLELVNDDYVPMLAIRANDKDHAAQAMARLRELGAKYSAQG